ncbi:hypothetical protein PSEUDO8BK_190010 [Pseudomonas sp. 8BK]|nr:hypothetical protein PSEUDO8BK_190010 [Pseudomonas sp. 8BK]
MFISSKSTEVGSSNPFKVHPLLPVYLCRTNLSRRLWPVQQCNQEPAAALSQSESLTTSEIFVIVSKLQHLPELKFNDRPQLQLT